MLFDKEKVMQFLPHRDPFLFVDTVKSVTLEGWNYGEGVRDRKETVGTVVEASYHCDESHPIFEGHFPGKPILPGVVQVEMMAQASSFAIVTSHPDPFGADSLDLALMSVSSAKFRHPVLPGMDLDIRTVLAKHRGKMMSCDCQIFHKGELMSEASVLAVINY